MRIAFNLWVAAAALIGGNAAVVAATPAVISAETRTYDIFIDGTRAGQSTLTITGYSDGSEVAVTDAKVTVGWAVFTYVYEFHGQERWLGGRLEQLSSRAVDGGRRLSLSATRGERGLSVAQSSRPPQSSVEVQLTTNYWRQPVVSSPHGELKILDADNGKLYDTKLGALGQQELTVAGKAVSCTGIRLRGAVDVELWFDSAGYLVRQAGMEEGHHTELRLIAVQQRGAALAGPLR